MIVVLFSVVLFIGFSYLENAINRTEENAIFLNKFYYNDELDTFTERKIDPRDTGVFEYETKITKSELDALDGDITLLVTRLRGNWHQIFWNGNKIGSIGTNGFISNNIWNDTYRFTLDENRITPNNTLSFKTYSDYKIGFSTVPIIIAGEPKAHQLYIALKAVHSSFYIVIISGLLALSLMQLLLFGMTNAYDKRYSLLPLSIVAIAVYMLDYVVFPYAPLSPLVFKKIVIVALYASTMIMGLALSRLYQEKVLQMSSLSLLIMGLILALFSTNSVVLSTGYNYLNLFLLINVCMWLYYSLRAYLKDKQTEDFMIAIASILLLLPGTYDTIILLLGFGQKLRMTVFGVTFYAVAVLLIAMTNYIDYQKKIYLESKQLIAETERLSVALLTDELTGLSNHRRFFEKFQDEILSDGHHTDILFIDIDQFRAINNALGHTLGDDILKRISEIIVRQTVTPDHAFRFGGEEFVMMCNKLYYDNAQVIAEKIRQDVVRDEKLKDMCGFYTLTVSIGIANYPVDSVAPKMVVRKAEKANEFAKIKGRNRVVVYNRQIENELESTASQQLKKTFLSDFVLTLAAAIDMKDVYTGKHSEEVTRYALMIADAMKLSDDMKYALKIGSMLHDLGKIAIPDAIIKKVTRLDHEEFSQIKKHTKIGYDLITELVDDNLVVSCIRNHHERMDGKGYPDQLIGEEIPLLARIVCVADAYHAMISTRSYRVAMTQQAAIEQLKLHSGTQFDGNIVDVFIHVITGRS
jgi:diguanylate cyclase (GGDEF)-like protein/putative nucleotidyltransferase with HDIG domain